MSKTVSNNIGSSVIMPRILSALNTSAIHSYPEFSIPIRVGGSFPPPVRGVTRDENPSPYDLNLNSQDFIWIVLCSIIIFTMQTGFGLLEQGIVRHKSEVSIMMKNLVDIIMGGLSYWLFGFAITFGTDKPSSPILGFGEYVVDSELSPRMGPVFTSFFFQLSFATTATTIASGSIAERFDFRAYCLFSLLNPIIYCIPARWIWGPTGWLAELGVIDIAGSGCVHLVGGFIGFAAAWMLGPRLGRYEKGIAPLPLGNPVNVIVGLCMLWWAWIAFNAGSTFGVSDFKWLFAARAAATTMIASIGGGTVGVIYCFIRKKFEVLDIVNPILGGLVGITAPCALVHTVDSFVIGIIGGLITIAFGSLPDRMKVDDVVGASVVHGLGGIWGLLAVGLFAEDDKGILGLTQGRYGVLRGGGWYLLGVQTLAAVSLAAFAIIGTIILLFLLDKIFIKIRISPAEELLGPDFVEHNIFPKFIFRDEAPGIYSKASQEDCLNYAKFIWESSKDKNLKMQEILDLIHQGGSPPPNNYPLIKEPSKMSARVIGWVKFWNRKDSGHIGSAARKNQLDIKIVPPPKFDNIQEKPNNKNVKNWENKFASDLNVEAGKETKLDVTSVNDPARYFYPSDYRKNYANNKKTYIWMT